MSQRRAATLTVAAGELTAIGSLVLLVFSAFGILWGTAATGLGVAAMGSLWLNSQK